MTAGADPDSRAARVVDALTTRHRTIVVRGALLALVAALALLQEPSGLAAVCLLLLLLLGVGASLRLPPAWLGWLMVSAEVVTCCVAIAVTGGSRSPLLPYLLAPALATGLVAGARAAVLVSGLAAATLIVVRASVPEDTEPVADFSAAAAQWILLGLAAGLVAAWVRQVLAAAAQGDPQYAAAHRLLTDLRNVARTLPGNLDTASTTSAVLDELASTVPFDRATVLLHGQGRHLVPVAVRGVERSAWATSLDGSGPVAEAWATGQPVVHADGVSLPWHSGRRVNGVVVLSRDGSRFSAEELASAQGVLTANAVRLDTATLFDEIRGLATVDERRRLGREIHDGIAQDLVFLGYELDAALDALPQDPTQARSTLVSLRESATRILNELRMSVYELRSDVDGDRGLSAALSDHVRRLGNNTDLTVHLTLSESGQRLNLTTEAEVVRIAQEALSNARRHSGAKNLWVELLVDPPVVRLRVEDDGTGIDPGFDPGFGLSIMRERSERIGAELTVRNRHPHGTCVDLSLIGR